MKALCLLPLLAACHVPDGIELQNTSGFEVDEPLVWWAFDRLRGYESRHTTDPLYITFQEDDGEPPYGLYFDNGTILVDLATPCLSDSALVHELVHFRCHRLYGDLDHKHDRVDWYLVQHVNAELREMESTCDE